jgi:hypothetical protein
MACFVLIDRSASGNPPDIQEAQLRQLCLRYWGKGEEGRLEIYQTHHTTVPYLNDPTDNEVTLDAAGESEGESEDEYEDAAGDGSDNDSGPSGVDLAHCTLNTSTTITSPVSYTALSLGFGFKEFFPRGRDKILVRDEYPAMIKHIKTIQEQGSRGGVVVIGQPGIGKELSQYLQSNHDLYSQENHYFSTTHSLKGYWTKSRPCFK